MDFFLIFFFLNNLFLNFYVFFKYHVIMENLGWQKWKLLIPQLWPLFTPLEGDRFGSSIDPRGESVDSQWLQAVLFPATAFLTFASNFLYGLISNGCSPARGNQSYADLTILSSLSAPSVPNPHVLWSRTIMREFVMKCKVMPIWAALHWI